MKSLSQYITEYNDKEVKNPKLRKLLDKAGFQDIKLIKGNGYFYIVCDDPNSPNAKHLDLLDNTAIFVNSFNQQTPEEWFNDIQLILAKL